jgi:hypothetical protein
MAAPADIPGVRTKRTRQRSLVSSNEDRADIAKRVSEFYRDDIDVRQDRLDKMLQLNAKLRQWTEGKTYPWDDASDAAVPDILIDSLRMQDTLVNAVLSGRPAVTAKGTTAETMERQEGVDDLLDYQLFIEQSGEAEVERMAKDFTDDGCFQAFIPWIRETRNVIDLRTFDTFEAGQLPRDHFVSLLESTFPREPIRQTDPDGWDWVVNENEDEERRVKFYTKDDEIEMEVRETALVYEGPRVLVKDWQDVLHPARCENLQAPGPSNPNGASHVILVDYPTLDELRRLQRQGRYDLITAEMLKELESAEGNKSHQEVQEQRDTFQGESEMHLPNDPGHKRFTRLTCFDCYDVDGDGLGEEVVWFVLLEKEWLLKAATLGELYPGRPSKRPFAESAFLPVPGRRWGMGLPELQEGIHDLTKELIDQMLDANSLRILPWGFYRAASNMNPEALRLGPGDLAPTNDPKNDVHFPQLSNSSMSDSLNIVQLLGVWGERLTTIGDLQLGRVPFGKASALRTATGMQTVLAQGEARPERILRRFFGGLSQVYEQMHRRNQFFMPDRKRIRIQGTNGDVELREVKRADVDGLYDFEFTANVLNASKQAQQESLQQIAGLIVSPIALQMGVTNPQKIHRLFFDLVKSLGTQMPAKYMNLPEASVMGPQITWQEALLAIMGDQAPTGNPAEGAIAHLQAITGFAQSDELGLLTPSQVDILQAYMAQLEQQAAQMQQAIEQFQTAQGGGVGGEGGRPPEQPPVSPNEPTRLSPNELADETLAGNGRGVA